MTTPLLLVHAFPLDSTMWADQLSAFPGAIAPDLPGFGSAPESGGAMSMSAAAARCIEALDATAAERAVVCGLSMGGYVAFEIWRRHRDRVAGLIFANTRAEADDEAGVEKRMALSRRLTEEGSGFLVESPPPLLSASAGDELRERVKQIIAAQSAAGIGAASVGMAQRPDSTPDLPGISVPVLVINSSEDALIPPDATARIAESIPHASLATIEGAGHLSNLEDPARFNAFLQEFLSRPDF